DAAPRDGVAQQAPIGGGGGELVGEPDGEGDGGRVHGGLPYAHAVRVDAEDVAGHERPGVGDDEGEVAGAGDAGRPSGGGVRGNVNVRRTVVRGRNFTTRVVYYPCDRRQRCPRRSTQTRGVAPTAMTTISITHYAA